MWLWIMGTAVAYVLVGWAIGLIIDRRELSDCSWYSARASQILVLGLTWPLALIYRAFMWIVERED